ncbi:MAG: ATP-binding protein, partial [Candidatus Omnitrophota bacterium]|nr:ATP-binding protein [Candidatus Omnitrophota bacterium]
MRFFDRKSIIELLNRRVFDLKEGYRQNLALLGPEFIGKTSILEEFLAQLGEDNIIPVYLALGEIDFDIFVQKFIGRLLFNFLKNKNISPADNFEVLLQESQRFIPLTAQHIKKICFSLDKDKRIDAYRDLLSLPEIFEQETGCFCLVILDEFHHLEEFELPNIFQELGKKIMVQKK